MVRRRRKQPKARAENHIACVTLAQDSRTNRAMMSRFLTRRAGGMLWRNTVVSTGVFLVGLALLWVLVEKARVDPVLGTAISFLAANTIHYGFGRTWIFAGTDRKVSTGYLLFLCNAVVGLVITVSMFWALTYWTPIHYLVARILVSVFAGLAVFALNAGHNFNRL